jgi:2-polyprenyl-3-methyl-5-hydroxy-6-metoxy-1,4-benzoquinol methylase
MDNSSDSRFKTYYEEKSTSATARQHFERIRLKAMAMLAREGRSTQALRVVDIGCNAGTQALMWAKAGHRVTGLDVNGPLLEVARERARSAGLDLQFDLGTATKLPYADGSMDVCLMLELLEHVQDWEACVNEAVRVLAPGGLLYLSTTNALCPLQQEFDLPMYSWYPGPLKRYFEKLAVTTKPELANYARYPAVHWFTYYGLKRYLVQRQLRCFDRFDRLELVNTQQPSARQRMMVACLKHVPPLRFIGHVLTPGTSVMALK